MTQRSQIGLLRRAAQSAPDTQGGTISDIGVICG